MNLLNPNLTFINRDDELRMAQDRLLDLRSGKRVSEPILFFHGIPLIGKSTLLYKIQQKSIQNLIPSALIDFENGFWGVDGKMRLIRNIVDQWEATAEIGIFAPLTKHDSLGDATEKLIAYARQLRNRAHPTPVALFLDTLEAADSETFDWLQDNILEKGLHLEHIFVAIAARTEHSRLHAQLIVPILSRTRFVHLKVFTAKHTQEHISVLLRKTLSNTWQEKFLSEPHRITHGIPGLNEAVLHQSFMEDKHATTYLVEKIVFRQTVHTSISLIGDLLLILAAFRRFDLRLLSRIANHFWPNIFTEVSRDVGVNLARQLSATLLLEAREDGYGYVISPDLRPLLDEYQRYRGLQQHFETHCLAYQWFQDEVLQGNFISVIDQLYHLAGAWFDWDHNQEELRNIDNLALYFSPEISRTHILVEILRNGLGRLTHGGKSDVILKKIRNTLVAEHDSLVRLFSLDDLGALLALCDQLLEEFTPTANKQNG